ncbi:endonuclease/exonuclease/phosphatase family protein [Microvirga thermotolerans]|uniref:endonuclease/exonuclease/phosphatase family protein n=1 Tax=Microvirga thermotolerans TaxID=2651334 RepID=UPI0018839007|nr:endonuclease/exonuclease/phosphatase family protein [Microvirga thermotolerans]
MRSLVDETVSDLPAPPPHLLDEARLPPATPERHARFLNAIDAFRLVEARAPRATKAWPRRLRVAAFNAQRLKRPDAARALLDRAAADVALLSEVDLGMARSGNGHPLRRMIGTADLGYLYGVEFVELDLGDPTEIRRHAGERNERSLHGNAVVSGLALADACVIPLEESGFWFPGRQGAQRRIGGRIAVAARLAHAPKPLWIAGLHLESKTDPADRRDQVRALLRAVDRIGPRDAWILGGDFNTKELPRDPEGLRRLLDEPGRFEPLFDDLAAAGFSWASANLPVPTQRTGPQGRPSPPFAKLDWLVARGVVAASPQVLPALDADGRPISDHDMAVAEFFFDSPADRA